jgi:hypothetical protein
MKKSNRPDNGSAAEFATALGHLRREFFLHHFGAGELTSRICVEIIHFENPVESYRRRKPDLKETESMIGAESVARFEALLQGGNVASIVAAFFELYVASMSVYAANTFRTLLKIALAKRQHIKPIPLEWAQVETLEMVESKKFLIRSWVRCVCDQRVFGADERDSTWEAPRFLIMEPLGMLRPGRQTPFDPSTAWGRFHCTESKMPLDNFEWRYDVNLKSAVTHAAGEAAVEMSSAKPPDDKSMTPTESKKDSTPREETQAMYATWQARYTLLKAADKDMVDTTIAEKISRERISRGKSISTIRHNMKL